MKKRLLTISTAMFLSALVWSNGNSIAFADSGQESVSRTQIEEHFNRSTRRTRKKIEAARKLRLQRYSPRQSIPAVSAPTIIQASEIICSKTDVYNNPYVYTITKKRLVERIAKYMNIDKSSALRVLKFPESCIFVHNLSGSIYNVNSVPDREITSLQIPIKRSYVPRSGKQKVIVTTHVNPAPVAIVQPKEGLFPSTAKIRILCRVQERGYANRAHFDANIEAIAQQFATKWNTSISAIVDALQNQNLCKTTPSSELLASLEAKEAEEEEELKAKPVLVDQNKNSFIATVQQKIHSLLSLPRALLTVGILALITFLILIGLFIAPFFQNTKE